MENVLGVLGTSRGLALALAVIHHGLACFAENSVPARVETVVITANTFERYISGQR
jgi:hypothetical protein